LRQISSEIEDSSARRLGFLRNRRYGCTR
jgi:hypothetical protein